MNEFNSDGRLDFEVRWCGITMRVIKQPPEQGRDAKGREWGSLGGWYFSCEDCGNSGLRHHDPEDAVDEALIHAQGHVGV